MMDATVPSGWWHSSTTASKEPSVIQAWIASWSWVQSRYRVVRSIRRWARMSAIAPMITSVRWVAVCVLVVVRVDVDVLLMDVRPSCALGPRGRPARPS
jgi:hypothetical protein